VVTLGSLSTAIRLATAKLRGVSTAGAAVCKIHIPAGESIAAQGSARDFFTIAFSLLVNYWKHKMSEHTASGIGAPPRKCKNGTRAWENS
jgi:hypothetical protein